MLVFPTRVGMNRLTFGTSALDKGIPHTRGDEPRIALAHLSGLVYSPHAWG